MTTKRKTTKTTKRNAQSRTLNARAKWEAAFLAAIRQVGVVSAACQVAEIPRRTAYSHRERSKRFEKLWDEALEDFADSLEVAALRRAKHGLRKAIYYKGKQVGTEFEYSDQLMALMLKAKRPDQYADKLIIKVDPAHLAILNRLGMSPSDAWEQFIQELANETASTGSH